MCPQATNAGERLVGMLIEIFNGRPIEDLKEIWKVAWFIGNPPAVSDNYK